MPNDLKKTGKMPDPGQRRAAFAGAHRPGAPAATRGCSASKKPPANRPRPPCRERENTLRERDEQLRAQQIRSHAQAELNRRGLPQSLLGALQCGSEEALTQSLAAVEGAFRESLERGVRDRLRGGAPSAPIGAQLPDKKQRLSYQQAASLYQKQRLAGRDNE